MDRHVLARRTAEIAHGLAEGASVVSDLRALLDDAVGVDLVTFRALTVEGHQTARVLDHVAPTPGDDEDVPWQRLAPSHPYARWLEAAQPGTSRLTDLVDVDVLERIRAAGPVGHRYQASLLLQRRGVDVRVISVWRGHRDFTDEEVEVLEQVRRLVDAGFAMREAVLDVGAWAGPQPEPVLTPRQREVASLVATGYTNAQVGRRLGISPRTVRKHLADLFALAGVSSRTGLAAWWHQGGRNAI